MTVLMVQWMNNCNAVRIMIDLMIDFPGTGVAGLGEE